MRFRGVIDFERKIMCGKLSTGGFYPKGHGVKPMQCVDLVAESKEARGPAPITEPYDVTKFLSDFKKNFNVD